MFIFINASLAFAGPNRTTYQAKIVKPDGYPLEASSVNFKFTIMEPAGTCILYSETYSNVNMSSTGGMISFALGSGVKSYPASATTFEQVFSNITPALSCDAGGPPSYSPLSTDIRKIVMQFHDGAGWQTLPAMSINAVPYAMFANEAATLNGKTDAEFVEYAGLPTCLTTEALHFNGTSFSCLSTATASVSAAAVVAALGYTPAAGASVTAIASSLSTTDSTVASVSSTLFSVSSTVSSLSDSVTSLENTVAASFAAMTSSQWVTSGTAISYNAGSVSVSGSMRISMDAVSCSANSAGTLRYNAGVVEYCNGAIWSAFGVAGAGITLLNGSASGSQTFGTGINGTVFNITSVNGVHTFNIPLAASAGVTAGLVSNADFAYLTDSLVQTATSFTTFTALQATNAASFAAIASAQASNAASFASVSNSLSTIATSFSTVANNQVINAASFAAVANTQAINAASFAAITSSQWQASATTISYTAGRVGIGTSTPITLLDLTGDLGAGSNLNIYNTNVTDGRATIRFRNDRTVTQQYEVGIDPGGSNSKHFAIRDLTASGAPVRMALTSSGNLGVGTVNPTERLSVSGNINIINPGASVDRRVSIATNGGGEKAYVRFDQTAAPGPNNYWDVGSLSGNNTYDFGFESSGTRRMTLTFGGNLGVGVQTPSAKLQLAAGNSSLAPFKLTSGSLTSSPSSGAIEYDGSYYYITDGSNTRRAIATVATPGVLDASNITSPGNMTLTPTGSVVVSSTTSSTDSTTGALVVKGGLGVAGNMNSSGTILTTSNIEGNGIKTKGTSAYLEMHDTDTLYSANPQSALVFRDSGNSQYSFMGPVNGVMTWNSWLPVEIDTTAGVDLYVSMAGRVGIGTSSTIAKLHVTDTNRALATETYNAMIATSDTQAQDIGASLALAGQFGSGSTPTAFASVSGRKENSTAGNYAGYLSFATRQMSTPNSDERMRITSTGNVGIGTASPAEKFVVNGKVILGGTSTFYTGASSFPSIAADAANASALILNGGSIANTWRIKNANGVLDFLTCADATCVGGTQYMKLNSAGLTVPGAVSFGASMVPGLNQYVFNGNASPVDLFAEPYPFGDNAGSDLYLRSGDASTGSTNKNGGTLRLASGKATGTGSSNIEFRTADSTNVSTKMYINGVGNVGIGTTAPTAKLHLAAGTTSNASLKITSGSLLSTPADGAIEYDGTSLYYTDSTNTRRALASNSGSQTNSANNSFTGVNTFTGATYVSNNTASTNSTTGALVVSGGVGVGGAINSAGAITSLSGISAVSNVLTNGYFIANQANTGPPTSGTRSVGTRFVLYPLVGPGLADHAMGIDTLATWYSVPDSSRQFQWYAGETPLMALKGNGNLGVGTVAPQAKLDVSGDQYIQGTNGINFHNGSYSVGSGIRELFRVDQSGLTTGGTFTLSATRGGFVHASQWAWSSTHNGTGKGVLTQLSSGQYSNIFVYLDVASNGSVIISADWGAAQAYSISVIKTAGASVVVSSAGADWATVNPGYSRVRSVSTISDGFQTVNATFMGNVGIGTNTPKGPFHIKPTAGSYASGSMILEDSSGSSVYGMINSSNNLYLGYNSNSGGAFPQADYQHRMVISSAGNVGIGMSSPASPLSVSGTGGTGNGPGVFSITATANNANVWASSAMDSELTAGNGILHLIGQAGSTNNSGYLAYRHTGSASATNYMAIGLYNNDNILNVTGAGRIGIGTTAPSYRLQVQKTASATPAIMIGGGHAGGPRLQTYGLDADANAWMGLGTDMSGNNYEHSIYTSGPGVNGKITFGQYDGNSFTERMRIHGDGNVGIGTNSPSSKFEIKGTVLGANLNDNFEMQRWYNSTGVNNSQLDVRHIRTSAGNTWLNSGMRIQQKIDATWMGYMQFNGTGNDAGISFGTGQTTVAPGNTIERLRITQTGYVGIGTTAPSEMLEVSGSVKATAYLYTSDERLKKEIITLPDALEKALKLRGVNFVWRNNNEKTVGFIAQEVEAVYPELVKTDKITGYKAVQYGNIVAILVEALKQENEQRVRSIANVEEKSATRMNQLEKENQELKARLEKIEKFLNDKVK